jgi:hypothetical protein
MNGDSRHGGQPWSVDLLADLHADGGDRSGLDAEALSVLAALDATQAELASLPPVRMPDDVAARIDAVLAAAAASLRQQAAPAVDLAEARHRRNRRLGWGGGLLAAAAVGVVVTVVPSSTTGGTPQAIPGSSTVRIDPPTQVPLSLSDNELGGAVPKVLGSKDYGTLDTPQKLSVCIAANGLDPNATPLGVRRVQLDNQDGIMIILPTGKVVRYQLLVVQPTCAAGNPATIAKTIIGG